MTDPDINVKAGKEGVEISILTGPRLAEGAPHRGRCFPFFFLFFFLSTCSDRLHKFFENPPKSEGVELRNG